MNRLTFLFRPHIEGLHILFSVTSSNQTFREKINLTRNAKTKAEVVKIHSGMTDLESFSNHEQVPLYYNGLNALTQHTFLMSGLEVERLCPEINNETYFSIYKIVLATDQLKPRTKKK